MKGTTIKSAWPIESVTLRAYCRCGGAIHLTTNPAIENVTFVMETFANAHAGKDHEPCDAKAAAKARRARQKAFA
ncbi:hypothetical protein LCGC14_2113570 [marine sediment metagenome]|uniref:Uncharacterized protein n=1 Tax=marine sediment metagenome TaxID=412755 RepID=A0A0F9E6C4_9ZZZZ